MTANITERNIKPGLEFETPGSAGIELGAETGRPEELRHREEGADAEKGKEAPAELPKEAKPAVNTIEEIAKDPEVPEVIREKLLAGLKDGSLNPLTAPDKLNDPHDLLEALLGSQEQK